MHNINMMLIGHPGVGKTAMVETQYKDATVKLLLSSMVEEDVSGLPWREGVDERRTKPMFIKQLEKLSNNFEKVCLFLDEMDKARQEVADTLLTLVQSRQVGEWKLPINCDIIAAANPPETGGGFGISEPMQSRFTVIEFIPNPEAWANWCIRQYPEYKNIADLVRSGEIPLFDFVGEGLDKRTVSPRTLENAMNAKDCVFSSREEKISGLLPPEYISHFAKKQDILQHKCSVVARQVANNSVFTPLRLKEV